MLDKILVNVTKRGTEHSFCVEGEENIQKVFDAHLIRFDGELYRYAGKNFSDGVLTVEFAETVIFDADRLRFGDCRTRKLAYKKSIELRQKNNR